MAATQTQAIQDPFASISGLPSRTLKNVKHAQSSLEATILTENHGRSRNRNPFDSPSLSTSSLVETDDGSTSGQDELHLERYSSVSKHNHLRQNSRSTNPDDRDKRPDLNIITDFSAPKMPMKSAAVVVNEVPAKQVRADRRAKGTSVVSHKAVQAIASPWSDEKQPSQFLNLNLRNMQQSKESKKSNSIRRLQNAMMLKQRSPLKQRFPIGITVPKRGGQHIDQQVTDSALPVVTPMTPAIVITPAGEQKPWVLQRHGTDELNRPASSIYSAMPTDNLKFDPSKVQPMPSRELGSHHHALYQNSRDSRESSEMVFTDSADTARPQSQGWWNLMLSPLLRAGSLASRKGLPPTETPPVPPLPFHTEKTDSPALSVRSDPSFLISPNYTSPDTPRRQGLASARTSTWSRWTEWEQEREANSHNDLQDPDSEKCAEVENSDDHLIPMPVSKSTGLAAEYFHACAIEQLTGRPYFECINHSCAEKLPRLHSEFIGSTAKGAVLASPFQTPLDGPRAFDFEYANESKAKEIAETPVVAEKPENLSPNELSPNVRQAGIASVVKAKTLDKASDKAVTTSTVETGPEQDRDKANTSASSDKMPLVPSTTINPVPRTNNEFPNIATVAQPSHAVEQKLNSPPSAFKSMSEKSSIAEPAPLASPASISPQGQNSLAPVNGMLLTDVKSPPPPLAAPVVFNNYALHQQMPTRPAFITAETEYPPLPERAPTAPVTAADINNASRKISIEERRQRHEKEDAAARKVGGFWRGRGCLPINGCMRRGGTERRTKRRWICVIAALLLAIIITCIVLAITLTRKGDNTPLESQWLNLTGYPPMPIGILTIATPNLIAQQKQCTDPTTMWSCSVPKESQDEIGSNDPDQPNFRFEVKFRNGTVPANMTISLSGVEFGKTSKDPFTNDLFIANPPAPNQADQTFLGRTTDNITAPFDGEITPFYITFMSTFPQIPTSFNNTGVQRLLRRQSNSSVNAIPAAALADDGSAAPATLLPTAPFPVSQPIRLYNRGLNDEHYGFYTYYDKSIYLSGLQIQDNKPSNGSSSPAEADQDGGCLKSQATAVCTFSQTRFLFKVFTNSAFGGALLSSPNNSNLTNPDDKNIGQTSSATNFERPGSFPYPTSIVVDRHGGDIDSKAIYCYGMQNGKILTDQKMLNGEIRSFGGQPVNGAPSILSGQNSFNSSAGGIDGGTGGCFCNWQNWQ